MLYWDTAGGNPSGYQPPPQWRATTIGAESSFFGDPLFKNLILPILTMAAGGALGSLGGAGAGAAEGAGGAAYGAGTGLYGAAEAGGTAGLGTGLGSATEAGLAGGTVAAGESAAPSYLDRFLAFVKEHPYQSGFRALQGGNTLAGLVQQFNASTQAGQVSPTMDQAAQAQEQQLRLLPSAKADWASRVGGGMSPQFLQAKLGEESPSSSLDILQQIYRSLNVPGGPS